MRVLIAVGALLLALAPPAHAASPSAKTVRRDLAVARSKLRSSAASQNAIAYPWLTTSSGAWRTQGPGWWTSGFFPGSLWLTYAQTGDPAWRARAKRWQAGLKSQKDNTSTHDVGFMLMSSFGNGYAYTGAGSYRRVVQDAARSLASRFNSKVGCTRSLGSKSSPTFTVLIDNMMNLELLFWAARHGGDPRWRQMAISHALRTRQEFVRPDGSTFHVVDFSAATGKVLSRHTMQGASNSSTWSRGQAWALYGFTTAYQETHDARFLDTAQRTADYFLAHLPADKVPYWDFSEAKPGQPRDSSAAAIAASGLLELARVDPDRTRATGYRTSAGKILGSLSSSAYLARHGPSRSILLHGTSNKPAGQQDSGLVYGDYYFIEALERYQRPTLRLKLAHHVLRIHASAPGVARVGKRTLRFRHAGSRSLRLHGGARPTVRFKADNGLVTARRA